jgi:hypothetical protein
LSVGAAAAAYIFLGRRYQSSDTAVKTRIELRTAIDGIHFTESEFIKQVESYMAWFDELEPADMLKAYLEKPFPLEPDWAVEADALLAALKPLTEGRGQRAVEKRLLELGAGKAVQPEADRPLSLPGRKTDLPLIFLSKKLREKQPA